MSKTKITASQRYMLIVELWPKVCAAQGWSLRDEEKRHEIYARLRANGKLTAERMGDFNRTTDVDAVKAAFMLLIDDTNLDAQLNPAQQPRIRMFQRINEQIAVLGLNYAIKIAKDKFGHQNFDSLTDTQLRELLITLTARARSHANSSASGLESDPCGSTRAQAPVAADVSPLTINSGLKSAPCGSTHDSHDSHNSHPSQPPAPALIDISRNTQPCEPHPF